ncbi:MAG: hypothetical protein HYU39_04815 [Thaumarchaeota archaeon]|nr:hypothetical protein [Nitrososphaerota archaeon]
MPNAFKCADFTGNHYQAECPPTEELCAYNHEAFSTDYTLCGTRSETISGANYRLLLKEADY